LAAVIRMPDESLAKLEFSEDSVLLRLRCALMDARLVLITSPMLPSLEAECGEAFGRLSCLNIVSFSYVRAGCRLGFSCRVHPFLSVFFGLTLEKK
jgi:hypothetical protein